MTNSFTGQVEIQYVTYKIRKSLYCILIQHVFKAEYMNDNTFYVFPKNCFEDIKLLNIDSCSLMFK